MASEMREGETKACKSLETKHLEGSTANKRLSSHMMLQFQGVSNVTPNNNYGRAIINKGVQGSGANINAYSSSVQLPELIQLEVLGSTAVTAGTGDREALTSLSAMLLTPSETPGTAGTRVETWATTPAWDTLVTTAISRALGWEQKEWKRKLQMRKLGFMVQRIVKRRVKKFHSKGKVPEHGNQVSVLTMEFASKFSVHVGFKGVADQFVIEEGIGAHEQVILPHKLEGEVHK
ncbi:hypothetical protein BDN71DRAFT_1436337 [Pleurotus eryngii]|uniref:Uncharacterized protein n=1 Tax=Pleurotus eryngii TaxID=5323 RepID=A0A9P5ZJC2_PLEER|nr:hypothetical protein BDN71DRAFT_1436337 [Pleurotus eryngii]